MFDDIKKARNVPEREQFLEYLANDPAPPRAHMGVSIKHAMAPGELDPWVGDMIYLAVSITNCCEYCIASHRGRAQR